VTYKIIAVHGGKIEVVSQEHQGTTFKILLPSILTTGQSVNKVVEM
jgi:signal transduction histidine kinase